MLKFSNFGKARIVTPPNGTAGLSFSIEAGMGLYFPVLGAGDYFYGILKNAAGQREIVRVEARNVDAMTIGAGGRGLDGTVPHTWNAGDYFVAGLVNAALHDSIFSAAILALSPLNTYADTAAYYNGSGTAALYSLTPFARALLDDPDGATARDTLGIAAAIAAAVALIPITHPPGTVSPFFQATAPVGWSQITTHNNKAIRIVGGTGAGSGGSVAFTTAFASQGVAGANSATTLSIAQVPSHTHTISQFTSGTQSGVRGIAASNFTTVFQSGIAVPLDAVGGGGSHNHTFTGTPINLAVQYIDMIIASKN